MSEIVDDLHARLIRKVHAILAIKGDTAEDVEWRRSALRDVYEEFGNKADKVRGVSLEGDLALSLAYETIKKRGEVK